jgi:hypothetical protein
MEVYGCAYHRSWHPQHIPLSRCLLPHSQLMVGVTGFDDCTIVNQCLLNRTPMSYEPYDFTRRPGCFPMTVDCGRKMDELRTELRD